MSDRKHIDRLFQEKFKDFEMTPDDSVWANIEAKLDKREKRRVVPIWWRYAGVAALLLLMVTVGSRFLNTPNLEVSPLNNAVNIGDTKEQPLLEGEKQNSIQNAIVDNDGSVVLEENLSETHANQDGLEKIVLGNKTNPNNIDKKKEAAVANNVSVKESVKSQRSNSSIVNNVKGRANIKSSLKESIIANNGLNEVKDNTSKSSQLAVNKTVTIVKTDNVITQKHNSSINNSVPDGANIKSSLKENAIANNDSNGGDGNTSKSSQIALNESNESIHAINDKLLSVKKGDDTTNKLEILAQDNLENEGETIEEAMAKSKYALEEGEEDRANRWNVTPNAAPVYFDALGKEGSSIGSQFNNSSQSGEVNISYGINASYAINKKLIVRSGINKVNLGYNTNNVAVFKRTNATTVNSFASIKGEDSTLDPLNDDEINNNIETNDVSLVSEESVKSSVITAEAFSSASSANINQSLGFIEVPIEFQYIVSDKKLGLNVIGGFSSFFLNNNELFSQTSDATTLIGEAVNVNDVSYSANFGFGINYKMTKKINLNFEPMFKYQINTFNNTTGDFKPYFIGVYTGIGFKF